MVARLPGRAVIALLVLAALVGPKALRAASPAKLRVEDRQTGKVIPARFYLADAAGKNWAPAGAITYNKNDEHNFISSGPFSIDLPAGRYSLTCERGPEYRPYTGSIDLKTGEDRAVKIPLERWIDMSRLGWPPHDEFCVPAHAQHAYVDAEKIMRRDVAALVALGLVDFAGVVHNHFNRHNVLLETDRGA